MQFLPINLIEGNVFKGTFINGKFPSLGLGLGLGLGLTLGLGLGLTLGLGLRLGLGLGPSDVNFLNH